jgi:hypothetical protein
MDKTTQAAAGIQEQTCREMGADAFNAAVKALRGTVPAKQCAKKKLDCTPAEWAAKINYHKSWEAANPEKVRAALKRYALANPEKRRAKDRAWAAANPEKRRANKQAFHARHKHKISVKAREWRAANNEWCRNYKRKYKADRRLKDHVFKIKELLRRRLSLAIRGGFKSGSAVRDLGCSVAELRIHLESQFLPGMTLDNMGTAWEIDHVFPLSAANLENRTEFLAVNNWRNLQPLTPEQNNDKNDTVTPAAQTLFDSLVAEFSAGVPAAA